MLSQSLAAVGQAGTADDGDPRAGPSYAERLGKPVDRFIGLLVPDRPVWRLNWSLTNDPTLFQPVGHGRRDTDPDITPENVGRRIFLRVERQTLRRLPRTGAVLFTIRTHQRPLECWWIARRNSPEWRRR